MAKQFFKDLPNTTTPLTATRLNGLLDGEEALGNLVVDSIRSKKLYTGSDERLQFNDGQEEYINKLIADGEIKKDDLKVVTYILKEENGAYYIEDIKN